MIALTTTTTAVFPAGMAAALIGRKLEAGMLNVGRKLVAAIGSSMKPGNGRPSAPGTPPNVQTAKLRDSLDSIYRRSGDSHSIIVSAGGDTAPYARKQEFGGTIHAKNAGALTVPINDAAKQASAAGQSARSINGLILIKGKGKEGGLLAKKRRNGEIDVWYVLRKSVTLPARPFMRPGLKNAGPMIPQWIAEGARTVQ